MFIEFIVLLLVAPNMPRVTIRSVLMTTKLSSPIYPHATSPTYANSLTINSKNTIYMPVVSVMNMYAIRHDN